MLYYTVCLVTYFLSLSENRHGETTCYPWWRIWGKRNIFIFLLLVPFAIKVSQAQLCLLGHLHGWFERWTSRAATEISWLSEKILEFTQSIYAKTLCWFGKIRLFNTENQSWTSLTAVHVHCLQLQICPWGWEGVLPSVLHFLQSNG